MKQKILIFAKAPIAGQVKTRLIPALGKQGAATMQRQLLHHTLTMATASGISTELWCSPDINHPTFDEYRQRYDIVWKNQKGSNLGERMSYAFSKTLGLVDAAILIGSDCPELRAAHIKNALEKLGQHTDVVLGPAQDGGYVLIGLKQHTPALFYDIPWGTSEVLSKTKKRIRQLKLKLSELPVLHDLDRPSDLKLFPELLAERL